MGDAIGSGDEVVTASPVTHGRKIMEPSLCGISIPKPFCLLNSAGQPPSVPGISGLPDIPSVPGSSDIPSVPDIPGDLNLPIDPQDPIGDLLPPKPPA